MTDREQEILEIIKENPMVSQQELADILNITRSSVAVHITNLMKKGYIKGKGYIISKSNFVTIIGGSNIDIQGAPNNDVVMFDSNPGKVDISLGGVGRNICENISKLGVNTKLLSAIGNDVYGNKIIHDCKKMNIDISDCYISDSAPTSMYLSILNNDNDMQLAISHMDIIDKIDIDYIASKHSSIKDSLAIESGDSPYANILAVKKENKDSDKIKALSDALTSEDVRKFIEEKYDGSVIPAF